MKASDCQFNSREIAPDIPSRWCRMRELERNRFLYNSRRTKLNNFFFFEDKWQRWRGMRNESLKWSQQCAATFSSERCCGGRRKRREETPEKRSGLLLVKHFNWRNKETFNLLDVPLERPENVSTHGEATSQRTEARIFDTDCRKLSRCRRQFRRNKSNRGTNLLFRFMASFITLMNVLARASQLAWHRVRLTTCYTEQQHQSTDNKAENFFWHIIAFVSLFFDPAAPRDNLL